jgi:hypothetical protein
VVVIALACLVVGCGAGSGSGSASADPHLTSAGYEALHQAVKLEDQFRGEHGLSPSFLKQQRTLCDHFAPTTDTEVEDLRSECVGGANQGTALLQIKACKKLPDGTQPTCLTKALQVLSTGTGQIVTGENNILQNLGKGPCYAVMHEGVPQDERLLVSTDQFLRAMTDHTVTQQILLRWQAALDTDAAEQDAARRTVNAKAKACRPS